MKKPLFDTVSIFLLLFMIGIVQAQNEAIHTSPVQISIWNPVQLAPDDWNIYGLRMNLPYGNNHDVSGIDIGIFNRVSGDLTGIQIGGYNFNEGPYSQSIGVQIGTGNSAWNMDGIQVGLFNHTFNCRGSQISIINHCTKSFTGVQLGLMNERGIDDKSMRMIGTLSPNKVMRDLANSGTAANMINGEFNGVQIGIYNGAYSSPMRGIQFGLHNYGSDIRGLQVGLINRAAVMKGIQIGAVNIISESPVPFLPIINAHF